MGRYDHEQDRHQLDQVEVVEVVAGLAEKRISEANREHDSGDAVNRTCGNSQGCDAQGCPHEVHARGGEWADPSEPHVMKMETRFFPIPADPAVPEVTG